MVRSIALMLFLSASLFQTGCMCCRGTWLAADVVDDISDHQPHLDNLYCPELDISRARMPDWNRCPLNRRICQHGASCRCEECPRVWYPSEYTTKYRAGEFDKKSQSGNVPPAPISAN